MSSSLDANKKELGFSQGSKATFSGLISCRDDGTIYGCNENFILLLLGMYVPVLDALRQGDWVSIGAFVSGCAIGLLSFVHLLRWMLRHWHDPIMALLAGFMAGSLVKLWPWRWTPEQGGREQWLSPSEYASQSGDAMLLPALLALFAGMLVVALLFRADRRSN